MIISANIQHNIWNSYFGVLRGATSKSNPKHGCVGHVLHRLMMQLPSRFESLADYINIDFQKVEFERRREEKIVHVGVSSRPY